MKPIKFKEANKIYAENQPQYVKLPAYVGSKIDNPNGEIVFCMGLSFKERVILLFTGKLWCSLLQFRNSYGGVNPLTPSFFSVKKSDFKLKGIPIGNLH